MRKSAFIIAVIIITALLVVSYVYLPTFNVTQLANFQVNGSVYNPLAIANGYVYANSYTISTSRGGVYCVNASTHAQVWNITWPLKGNNAEPDSLFVWENYTFINLAPGYVECVNSYSGVPAWNLTGTTITGPENEGYVYGRSTGYVNEYLLGEEVTYLSYHICAIKPSNGATLWNQTVPVLAGDPLLSGQTLYITVGGTEDLAVDGAQDYTSGLLALNAITGAKEWEVITPAPAGSFFNSSSLIISGEQLLLGSYSDSGESGNITFVASIYALNFDNGEIEWNYTFQGIHNQDSLPMVAGKNLIYVGYYNKIFALNSRGSVVWRYSADNSLVLESYSPLSYFSASGPIVFSEPLLYGVFGSNVVCLDANSGLKIWSFNVGQQAASGPYLSNGQVIVGSVGEENRVSSVYSSIYGLDARTGIEVWRDNVNGNPTNYQLVKDTLYVGTEYRTTWGGGDYEGNGYFYALKPGNSVTYFLELFAVLLIGLAIYVIIMRSLIKKVNLA